MTVCTVNKTGPVTPMYCGQGCGPVTVCTVHKTGPVTVCTTHKTGPVTVCTTHKTGPVTVCTVDKALAL